MQHLDGMLVHTGGTMSMGKYGRGSIISKLNNKKLNTKISTEVEIIGADDDMLHMTWTSYFL